MRTASEVEPRAEHGRPWSFVVVVSVLASWGGLPACGHDWSALPPGDADGQSGDDWSDGEVPDRTPDDGRDDGPPDAEAVTDDGPDDGLVDTAEDPGDAPPDSAAVCGNGILEEGEQCDGDYADCTTSCGSTGAASCVDCLVAGFCEAPAEVCSGADDDCDGETDEGFACRVGQAVSCPTACGSVGSGLCTAACELPGADGECAPPAESCNGGDDDCDGVTDEGCTPAGNDTCASPWNITGGGTFTGDTHGLSNDARNPTGCRTSVPTPADGPDAFFYFDLTAVSDVFLHTIGSAFDTVLYVGTSCGTSTVGCNDDVTDSASSVVDRSSILALPALAPGRYYLTLDGYYPDDDGPYSLTMYVTPTDQAGDRCGRPIAIRRADEVLTGDGCAFSDEVSGGCRGFAESVYYFTVSSSRTFQASACSSGTDAPTTLYLRSDCTVPTTELDCSDGSGTPCATGPDLGSISATVGPGIYFLFVENGRAASCGSFEVDLTGT